MSGFRYSKFNFKLPKTFLLFMSLIEVGDITIFMVLYNPGEISFESADILPLPAVIITMA
jgi:hypothetical protein